MCLRFAGKSRRNLLGARQQPFLGAGGSPGHGHRRQYFTPRTDLRKGFLNEYFLGSHVSGFSLLGWARGGDLGRTGLSFSLQSWLFSQNLVRNPQFSPFRSPPFPKCAKVPLPRYKQYWEGQATNAHQDRLPLYSKKGCFYFVSFWLIEVMYFSSPLG